MSYRGDTTNCMSVEGLGAESDDKFLRVLFYHGEEACYIQELGQGSQ